MALLVPGATPRASKERVRTGTVRVQVVFESGQPAAFVDVFLEGGASYQAAELADDEGRATFEQVPVGEYKLYAYAAGYRSTLYEGVSVKRGRTLRYSVTLRVEQALTEQLTVDARLSSIEGIVALHRGAAAPDPSGRYGVGGPRRARRSQSAAEAEISVAGGSSSGIGYRLNSVPMVSPASCGGVAVSGDAIRTFDMVAGQGPISASPPGDREGYDAIEPSDFHDAQANPLSTFAVDVDTASYSNVRRILRSGGRPPLGAVRTEELLNSFAYDDAGPVGVEPFGVSASVTGCPWNPEHRLVRVALKGRDASDVESGPLNLHFLVDVSGSMRTADKLPLVKSSLHLLLGRLNERDTVSLTVYASAAGVVLPPTSGGGRARIAAAIDGLQPAGSTNGAGGIAAAYRMARESFVEGGVNRVILATDGDFNVGASSQSELVTLIQEQRDSGIFLTVLGVGSGNLQDSRMEALANHGNGQYAYLDSLREAEKVLVRNAGGTLLTLAKDVKIQVEMNPAQVESWRLLGYENRELAPEDFTDDSQDGGEIGAGHSVVALYEIAPRRGGSVPERSVEPLRYQQPRLSEAASSEELLLVKLRWKRPDGDVSSPLELAVADAGQSLSAGSDDLRFSVAVAAFAEKLRSSEFTQSLPWSELRTLAAGAVGADPFGDRAEFLSLIDLAEGLAVSE